MSLFAYKAKNQLGEIVVGQVEAEDSRTAEEAIVAHRLVPISLEERIELGHGFFLFGRVPAKKVSIFTRSLATMLSAGLPLVQSLNLILAQTKHRIMVQVVANVVADVESGQPFSKAIGKYSAVFDPVYVNIARSGEATGKLAEVLAELAEQIEAEQEFLSKLKGALYYPFFIVVAMFAVGYIVMTNVIPQLAEIFKEAGASLPLVTQILIAVSDFTVEYWYLVIVGFLGLFLGGGLFFHSDFGRRLLWRAQLRIPGLRGLMINVYMARFSRVFSMLLEAGVPIIETLHIVSETMVNDLYVNDIMTAASEVERGIPLSVAISKSVYFPIMVSQLAAVGEQTGYLSEMMANLAKYYETEVSERIKGLTSVVEPAIIVLLGLGVGLIVFSVIIPLYSIAQFQ